MTRGRDSIGLRWLPVILWVVVLAVPGRARVLVVGLDGADWRVIDTLVEGGHIPTIANILAGSARAHMECDPALPEFACYCPPVWNTMSTGQPHAVHGILQGNQPVSERRAPAIWNIAHAFGKTTTLLTYTETPIPPSPVFPSWWVNRPPNGRRRNLSLC